MAIQVDDLLTLNETEVEQTRELLQQALQELNPNIDVRRGVIGDLVLGFSAILAAKNQVEQTRLQASSSLLAVLNDPTLADDELVNQIASNYRVTRQTGQAAGGAAMIVMSALQDVTIAAGARFTAQGQVYATEQAYTGRTSADNVVAATDRLMTIRSDGNYEFQISLVAVEEGEAGLLRKNSTLLPSSPPVGFVQAYAAEDFVGGLNAEDTTDLLNRFAYGASATALSSRSNMSATLRDQFEDVVADSIIGFGDSEMLRDQHSIFPVSFGGRVDWYVRTQPTYRVYGTQKTATLVEIDSFAGNTVWQIEFERDEYPGLYEVKVLPGDVGEYDGWFDNTADIRAADLTALDNDGFLPDIDATDAAEYAYSRFQSVIIKFRDTIKPVTGLTVGDTATYNVDVSAMPQIADIHDAFAQRSVRNVAGDILVKAPVPCFLKLNFTIELEPGQLTPDTSQIAADLADFVHGYGFTGRLPASALCDVVHNSLPGRSSATLIDMFGRIRRPDGTMRYLRDNELLEIPSEPLLGVSGRTVALFLDPADVGISIVDAEIPSD